MKDVSILNPSDKVRHYSMVTGNGAIHDLDNAVTDLASFPIGTQVIDLQDRTMYIRTASNMVKEDFTIIGEDRGVYFSNDFSTDFDIKG